MTEAKLIAYVNEHFMYELLMLRYSKRELEKPCDKLCWNAMFASFNVSARNIYDFLTEKEKDNRSVRLKDFNGCVQAAWRAGSTASVSQTLNNLNEQCLHLGKSRKAEPEEKVNLERVREVFAWIDVNMLTFIGSLSFRDSIDLSKADPEKISGAVTLRPPELSAATNMPGFAITTSTIG